MLLKGEKEVQNSPVTCGTVSAVATVTIERGNEVYEGEVKQ